MTFLYQPLGNEPDQYFDAGPFEGFSLLLHVRWNMRAGWTVSIYDANENPLSQGARLAVGQDLLAGIRYDPRCPPGELRLVDLTGVYDREARVGELAYGPSIEDPKGRFALVYGTNPFRPVRQDPSSISLPVPEAP